MNSITLIPRSLRLILMFCMTLYAVLGISVSSSTPAQNLTVSAECIPGTAWRWTHGPLFPEKANQLQQSLRSVGITAQVTARGFGETDSCGEFRLYEVDFFINIRELHIATLIEQDDIVEQIKTIVGEHEHLRPGRLQITLPNGETIFSRLSFDKNQPLSKEFANIALADVPNTTFLPIIMNLQSPAEVITRKVYVIVYDPLLSNGQHLSEYLGWNRHTDLTQETVAFFRRVTGGMLNYEIVYTTVVTDGWPKKIDGFRYSEAEYLDVVRGIVPPHTPDHVDYNAIVNSPVFDICGRANRGEIDEVWIYNGPWFGFYESTLVGPNAYFYNSPPVPGPHTCNRLIPIMGPSPERGLDSAIHNFGHRAESTMTKVYGSWQQNRTAHNWERFALVRALSPNYSYSGCGNIHYPPNGSRDYDYANTATVLSNCDDFTQYPNLSNPLDVVTPITCSHWDCDHLGFLEFWFRHIPAKPGCGVDNVAHNWWKYISMPELALNPLSACQ